VLNGPPKPNLGRKSKTLSGLEGLYRIGNYDFNSSMQIDSNTFGLANRL